MSLISFTEELLIDFRELVGEHSGENMAEAVWETLTQYGLIGRVCFIFPVHQVSMLSTLTYLWKIIAFVMDNATNNDTMAAAIERHCREVGVYFSAKESRMRCMPHTIHLAAIKVQIISIPCRTVQVDVFISYLRVSVPCRRQTVRRHSHEVVTIRTALWHH